MLATVTNVLVVLVLVGYFAPQLFITVYLLSQARLLYLSWKCRRKRKQPGGEATCPPYAENDWPVVTVQLPVFNEFYVVERLIDSVAALNYPQSRLEIQILDDSTDETTDLIKKKTRYLKTKGFDISHVRRPDRRGFKAGALAHGLTLAKGEFIAIFDADFLPNPDFLLKTIPHFRDQGIGVVQTKWEHINEDYSPLTRLQAFGLDAHFNIEQEGRNAGGHFINFNGTAGVWRKSCIIDAGNWQSDTLTEDRDLSYRAQLKGWRFKYLGEVGTPAELPVTMSALKTQQFRWSKGAAECCRKILPSVIKSKGLSRLTKIHAFFHLTNSTVFLCILLSSLLSIPLLFVKNIFPQYPTIYFYASFSVLNMLPLGLSFWFSATLRQNVSFLSFVRKFFMALSFSMGLSLQNSVAIWQGYTGKKIPFIRTPKFNIRNSSDSWRGKRYLIPGIDARTALEGLLTLYFMTGIYLDVHFLAYALLPFHIMLVLGFGTIFGYSLWHSRATPELVR